MLNGGARCGRALLVTRWISLVHPVGAASSWMPGGGLQPLDSWHMPAPCGRLPLTSPSAAAAPADTGHHHFQTCTTVLLSSFTPLSSGSCASQCNS